LLRSSCAWLQTRSTPSLSVVAAALALGWRLIWSQREDIFSDDAYYYVVVARNLATKGTPTFDGVSLTNGVHPLLLLLETGVCALLHGSQSPRVLYSVLVGASLGILGLLILYAALLGARAAARRNDDAFPTALLLTVSICLWPPFLRIFYNGMESLLVLPLGVALIVLVHCERFAWAGVAAALLVAARLDLLLFVVGPLAVWLGLEAGFAPRGHRIAARRVAVLLAPAGGLTSILLLVNRSVFGRAMPISGVLKSSFPRINLQWHQLFQRPESPLELISSPSNWALLAAVGAIGMALRHRRCDVRMASLSLVLACVTLLQLAGFILFQRWAKTVPIWYFAMPVLSGTMALASATALRVTPVAFRRIAWALTLVLLLLNGRAFLGAARYASRTAGFRTEVDETLSFMAARRPARWAATDCGKVAFWSGQSVVNLDGLINSWDFQDHLRRGELAAYLQKMDVRYLIATVWSGRRRAAEPMYASRAAEDVFQGSYRVHRYWVHSYLYAVDSDVLELPRESEVFRSRPIPDNEYSARMVVYDLAAAAEQPASR
jgi:hypothetical protein